MAKHGDMIRFNISKNSRLREGHGESVGRMNREELLEGLLRELRLLLVRCWTVELLWRMSKRLVEYSQHCTLFLCE